MAKLIWHNWNQLSGFFRPRRETVPEWLLGLAILIYSTFFSAYLTQKYDYFRTGYFDFGQAVQTVWLASQGHFNALSLGRPISIFTVIPYVFYPHPETLLALQSYVIGIGAIPVFYLARKHLKSDWFGLGFAILYLAYPPLWGVNQYEYHDLAFSITFLLFGIFFYDNRNLNSYCLSLTLALASS